MTYGILDTDGILTLKDGLPELTDIQGAVGGFFEALYLRDGTVMFLNEDGKFKGLPHNEFADALYDDEGRAPLMPGDHIVGNVVLVGPPDEYGGETSLTDAAEATLALYANEVKGP